MKLSKDSLIKILVLETSDGSSFSLLTVLKENILIFDLQDRCFILN